MTSTHKGKIDDEHLERWLEALATTFQVIQNEGGGNGDEVLGAIRSSLTKHKSNLPSFVGTMAPKKTKTLLTSSVEMESTLRHVALPHAVKGYQKLVEELKPTVSNRLQHVPVVQKIDTLITNSTPEALITVRNFFYEIRGSSQDKLVNLSKLADSQFRLRRACRNDKQALVIAIDKEEQRLAENEAEERDRKNRLALLLDEGGNPDGFGHWVDRLQDELAFQSKQYRDAEKEEEAARKAYEAAIANRKAAAFRFESIENLVEDAKVQRDTLVKVNTARQQCDEHNVEIAKNRIGVYASLRAHIHELADSFVATQLRGPVPAMLQDLMSSFLSSLALLPHTNTSIPSQAQPATVSIIPSEVDQMTNGATTCPSMTAAGLIDDHKLFTAVRVGLETTRLWRQLSANGREHPSLPARSSASTSVGDIADADTGGGTSPQSIVVSNSWGHESPPADTDLWKHLDAFESELQSLQGKCALPTVAATDPTSHENCTVVLYFDHILHETPENHVENQKRVKSCIDALRSHIDLTQALEMRAAQAQPDATPAPRRRTMKVVKCNDVISPPLWCLPLVHSTQYLSMLWSLSEEAQKGNIFVPLEFDTEWESELGSDSSEDEASPRARGRAYPWLKFSWSLPADLELRFQQQLPRELRLLNQVLIPRRGDEIVAKSLLPLGPNVGGAGGGSSDGGVKDGRRTKRLHNGEPTISSGAGAVAMASSSGSGGGQEEKGSGGASRRGAPSRAHTVTRQRAQLQLQAKVKTPYGKGVVEALASNPFGPHKVKLVWGATAYMNAQSLQVLRVHRAIADLEPAQVLSILQDEQRHFLERAKTGQATDLRLPDGRFELNNPFLYHVMVRLVALLKVQKSFADAMIIHQALLSMWMHGRSSGGATKAVEKSIIKWLSHYDDEAIIPSVMKLLNYPLMDDDGDDDEEFQSDVENLDGSAPLPSSSSMGYSDRKDFARGAPISSSSMSTRRDTMSNRADAEDSDESSLEDWAGGFRTEHRRSASSSGFGNESKIRKRQRWSGGERPIPPGGGTRTPEEEKLRKLMKAVMRAASINQALVGQYISDNFGFESSQGIISAWFLYKCKEPRFSNTRSGCVRWLEDHKHILPSSDHAAVAALVEWEKQLPPPAQSTSSDGDEGKIPLSKRSRRTSSGSPKSLETREQEGMDADDDGDGDGDDDDDDDEIKSIEESEIYTHSNRQSKKSSSTRIPAPAPVSALKPVENYFPPYGTFYGFPSSPDNDEILPPEQLDLVPFNFNEGRPLNFASPVRDAGHTAGLPCLPRSVGELYKLVTSEMQRRDLFQTEVAREAQLEVASLGKRYISQFLSSKSFSNNERGKQFAFLLLRWVMVSVTIGLDGNAIGPDNGHSGTQQDGESLQEGTHDGFSSKNGEDELKVISLSEKEEDEVDSKVEEMAEVKTSEDPPIKKIRTAPEDPSEDPCDDASARRDDGGDEKQSSMDIANQQLGEGSGCTVNSEPSVVDEAPKNEAIISYSEGVASDATAVGTSMSVEATETEEETATHKVSTSPQVLATSSKSAHPNGSLDSQFGGAAAEKSSILTIHDFPPSEAELKAATILDVFISGWRHATCDICREPISTTVDPALVKFCCSCPCVMHIVCLDKEEKGTEELYQPPSTTSPSVGGGDGGGAVKEESEETSGIPSHPKMENEQAMKVESAVDDRASASEQRQGPWSCAKCREGRVWESKKMSEEEKWSPSVRHQWVQTYSFQLRRWRCGFVLNRHAAVERKRLYFLMRWWRLDGKGGKSSWMDVTNGAVMLAQAPPGGKEYVARALKSPRNSFMGAPRPPQTTQQATGYSSAPAPSPGTHVSASTDPNSFAVLPRGAGPAATTSGARMGGDVGAKKVSGGWAGGGGGVSMTASKKSPAAPAIHNSGIREHAMDDEGEDTSDTYIATRSLQTALVAAGIACRAVDIVMSNENTNVFVCTRPPGHHAGRFGCTAGCLSTGFCLLNNAAIATAYARVRWGLERVAVVDIDVHYGNGTAEIMRGDLRSFFASVHMVYGEGNRAPCGCGDSVSPTVCESDQGDGNGSGAGGATSRSGLGFFPSDLGATEVLDNFVSVGVMPAVGRGTSHSHSARWAKAAAGASGESGVSGPVATSGGAEGGGTVEPDFCKPCDVAVDGSGGNVKGGANGNRTRRRHPLGVFRGPAGYRRALKQVIIPKMEAFNPQLLIISAGFDGFQSDPLGGELGLTVEDFAWCTKELVSAMERVAQAAGGGPARVMSILEGGYDVTPFGGLSRSAVAHVQALREA